MSLPFVRKLVPEPCAASLEEWQPAFFDTGGKLCPVMPSAAHAERYLDFLRHRIVRRPTDLTAHVRRILVARAYRLDKLIPGALQDLFRVLGDKGAGLRAHLLTLCAPLLDPATLQKLRGFSVAAGTLPPAIVVRSADIEKTAGRTMGASTTMFAEALACLEDGQVDEARNLLESHLVASPGDIEATRVLLDIYLRARDMEALESLRARLEPLSQPVQSLWDEVAANLSKRI